MGFLESNQFLPLTGFQSRFSNFAGLLQSARYRVQYTCPVGVRLLTTKHNKGKMTTTIQQLASQGESLLCEAVLRVLFQEREKAAPPEGFAGIGAAEIGELTGIYRDRGKLDRMNDAIVTGLLTKLHEEGKVELGGRGKWKLTEEGLKHCRESV